MFCPKWVEKKRERNKQIRSDRSHPSRTMSQVQELEMLLQRISAEFRNAEGKKKRDKLRSGEREKERKAKQIIPIK